jgi:hypothetical protein
VHKLLLLSMLIATFVLPMRAARDASAVRGLRHAISSMSIFVAIYVLLLIYVIPRI